MLRLSQQQADALAASQWQTALRQAGEHSRLYFQEVVAHLTDEALCQHLDQCFTRARSYGLTSHRDAYRFLNLALEFGWDFDTDIRHSWMRKRLLDPRLATPSERLEWLVKRCIHRLKIEEENLEKLRAFAPSEVQVDIYSPKIRDEEEYEAVVPILMFSNYLPAAESHALLLQERYLDAEPEDDEFFPDDPPLMLGKLRRHEHER